MCVTGGRRRWKRRSSPRTAASAADYVRAGSGPRPHPRRPDIAVPPSETVDRFILLAARRCDRVTTGPMGSGWPAVRPRDARGAGDRLARRRLAPRRPRTVRDVSLRRQPFVSQLGDPPIAFAATRPRRPRRQKRSRVASILRIRRHEPTQRRHGGAAREDQAIAPADEERRRGHPDQHVRMGRARMLSGDSEARRGMRTADREDRDVAAAPRAVEEGSDGSSGFHAGQSSVRGFGRVGNCCGVAPVSECFGVQYFGADGLG